MSKFSTFAFTLRPKDGIEDNHIKLTMGFVRRSCEYYHVVSEKSGTERHIHAGVVMKKPLTKSDITTRILRLFPDASPEEKRVTRHGVKIMYNMDFINNYLDKDDNTVVIGSSLPEAGCIESYFPPKPTPKEDKPERKCSEYYHQLERMWYENREPHFDVNGMTVRDFLFEMMYNKRCLPVIRDDKQIIQVSRHLTRWINKVTSSSIELPVFEKEEY